MPKSILTLESVKHADEIYRLARIVAYSRIEPRPRTRNFERSLQAAVHDPLWMLTRQWQFGEFRGEDAASPVNARINFRHWSHDRVALLEGPAQAFDASEMPLETRVERERIPLTVREAGGEVFSDALFALQWGKRFQRLLRSNALEHRYGDYVARFPLRVVPPSPSAGAPEFDPEAEQLRLAAEKRVADGVAIWRAVQDGSHHAWLDASVDADTPNLKAAAANFAQTCTAEFERLFTQPAAAADSAWSRNHLAYQLKVARGWRRNVERGAIPRWAPRLVLSRRAQRPSAGAGPRECAGSDRRRYRSIPAFAGALQGSAATPLLADGGVADRFRADRHLDHGTAAPAAC
jgi:hypothetical protein